MFLIHFGKKKPILLKGETHQLCDFIPNIISKHDCWCDIDVAAC